MKVYDFSDKKLLLIGDLSSNFIKIITALNKTYETKSKKQQSFDFNDYVMVVCGNCGFTSNNIEQYQKMLKPLNDILREHNNVLAFVRGNHDNPKYFSTNKYELGFENIVFIEDYSVLKTINDMTLCIGGATSINRKWYIKENARKKHLNPSSEDSVYWVDESVKEQREIASDLKESGLTINSIISHTCPLHFLNVEYQTKYSTSDWLKNDASLKTDLEAEWSILDNMLESLSKENTIEWWGCSHYRLGDVSKVHLSNGKTCNLNLLASFRADNFRQTRKTIDSGFLKIHSKTEVNSDEDIWGKLSRACRPTSNSFYGGFGRSLINITEPIELEPARINTLELEDELLEWPN